MVGSNRAASPGSFTTLGTGSNAITGWTIAGSIDYIGSYWVASEGSRSIDLNGYFRNGTVSQIVYGLIEGQNYIFFFDLAGNPDGPPPTKSLDVNVGGVAQNFSFPIGAGSHANLGWVRESFTFTATSSSAMRSFSPAGDPEGAFGPALDNVDISAAVPELSTWGMMLLGFGGLAMLARGRRRELAV